jgi:hypothetical protein
MLLELGHVSGDDRLKEVILGSDYSVPEEPTVLAVLMLLCDWSNRRSLWQRKCSGGYRLERKTAREP